MYKRTLIQAGMVALSLLLASCKPDSGPPSVSGTIETDEVRVASRYGGRVERILAQEGAALKAGQVIVELAAARADWEALGPGELLCVDTGCVVDFQPTVDFDIQYVGKIKSALFGGEGLFFAPLRGPCKIWLQSLPLNRMAGRIVAAVPGLTRGGREEGCLVVSAV